MYKVVFTQRNVEIYIESGCISETDVLTAIFAGIKTVSELGLSITAINRPAEVLIQDLKDAPYGEELLAVTMQDCFVTVRKVNQKARFTPYEAPDIVH